MPGRRDREDLIRAPASAGTGGCGAGRFASALAAVFVAAALILAHFAVPARADRLDDIRARGEIVIGVKADHEPFGYRNAAGDLVGFDIDVGRALAMNLGVEPVFVPVTTANRLQKLAFGEVDLVVATLVDTPERRKLVAMVEPHYYGGGAAVLIRPDSGATTWLDLRGRPVCVVQGAVWNRPFVERLLFEPQAYANARDARLALREGHCVALLHDERAIAAEVAAGDWPGYALPESQMASPWSVAVALDEAGGRLDRALGDIVAELIRSGFLADAERAWSLTPAPFLAEYGAVWRERAADGGFVCRRGADGAWPAACRHVSLLSGGEADGALGLALGIRDLTGLDLTLLYDGYDRQAFLRGLWLTILLSAACVAGSLAIGVLCGFAIHRRIPVLRPALLGLSGLLG